MDNCQRVVRAWYLAFTIVLMTWVGCDFADPGSSESVEKPAKPVSVVTLSRTRQLQRQLITGSVAPWKSEQIGFEVSGRVSFVIEPNEAVVPMLGQNTQATPIAKIDEERFRIAVETAEADVAVAERRLDTNRVAIEKRLPSAIESAKAELQLARSENDRAKRLSGQSAISRSELDSAVTRMTVAESALVAAEGELAQAEAEQLALKAQVARAQNALDEAQRNLRSTVLFSSFRGIVSAVHTVPGSYVGPGDPVVSIQMMDPMLVQFEVSAQQSREYAKGDILSVLMTDRQGVLTPVSGIVYTIDSVADPDSRTYTVTLQVRNEEKTIVPAGVDEDAVAKTELIYPLNLGPIITGDQRQLVEQRCLHQFNGETVVWKVTNRKWNRPSDRDDRMLTVVPIRVIASDEVIPLLGKWNFVPIQFPEGVDIDLESDLITSQLQLPVPGEEWTDRSVMIEQKDWLLRSGDVVQVAMTSIDSWEGIFVPMKAVLYKDGKTYVHLVEGVGSNVTTAKRVEVNVMSQRLLAEDSVSLQVKAVADPLIDGSQIVISGTHYLEDGDRVRMVQIPGSAQ